MEEENKILISNSSPRNGASEIQKISGAETASNSLRIKPRSNTFDNFSTGLEHIQIASIEFRNELQQASERKRQTVERK